MGAAALMRFGLDAPWLLEWSLEFEKVGDLLSGLLRIVDRHLGALLGAFADVLAHVFAGAAGVLESLFCPIRGLHDYGFCALIDFCNRALSNLQAVLADPTDFHASFFSA